MFNYNYFDRYNRSLPTYYKNMMFDYYIERSVLFRNRYF